MCDALSLYHVLHKVMWLVPCASCRCCGLPNFRVDGVERFVLTVWHIAFPTRRIEELWTVHPCRVS
jgi:hypothetical protein